MVWDGLLVSGYFSLNNCTAIVRRKTLQVRFKEKKLPGRMGSYAGVLSDSEMKSIVLFIKSLK